MFNFETALHYLKDGVDVTRAEWDNAEFLTCISTTTYFPNVEYATFVFGNKRNVPYNLYVVRMTERGEVVPWTVSQADMSALDWEVIEKDE